MGMVGGGEGAFIGRVHRMAAALDGDIELVCGSFSSNAERSRHSGAALHLPPNRVYGDYRTMMTAEANLPSNERMQFVAIVTPNDLHFPVAEQPCAAAFHVLSDRPGHHESGRGAAPAGRRRRDRTLVWLTKPIRLSTGERGQGQGNGRCPGRNPEDPGRVHAGLAGGPARRTRAISRPRGGWTCNAAGASSCMGDVGVHAANLAEYVSGLKITESART